MIFNNISFILHKPQLSENIGLCARGMKNFGFKNLLLIDPKPIFPNDKIIATSVGAKDIIKKTKVYSNLEKSLYSTDVLIATSARFRNKNIKNITFDDLKKINLKKNVSFLFGSEASGLTNNEINSNEVCLFMKGTPDAPQCGFSMAVTNILKILEVNFKGVNVLTDQNLREGIKVFSDWPTIPQLYVKNEFIGGCDIVKEMYENGELAKLFEDNGIEFKKKS